MRIERIEGNRKIRVRLTSDDLIDMNINVASLTPDSPELHRFLTCIMDEIKRETGFTAGGGRLMVEASAVEGGVTLTMTRLDIPPAIDPSRVRIRAKKRPTVVYRFAGFDAMCDYLCAASTDKLSKMRLYKLGNDFFAVTSHTDRRIFEFAQNLPTGDERFLVEHARLIASGDAVADMAENIRNLKKSN